jgi:hypothetical protein
MVNSTISEYFPTAQRKVESINCHNSVSILILLSNFLDIKFSFNNSSSSVLSHIIFKGSVAGYFPLPNINFMYKDHDALVLAYSGVTVLLSLNNIEMCKLTQPIHILLHYITLKCNVT